MQREIKFRGKQMNKYFHLLTDESSAKPWSKRRNTPTSSNHHGAATQMP